MPIESKTVEALAVQVVDALKGEAEGPEAPSRATLTSAILTLFRPYVSQAITGHAPKAVRDNEDRRAKAWSLSMEFWAANEAGKFEVFMGSTEGRDADKLAYGSMDVVTGLDGAAELLATVARSLDITSPDFEEPSFSRAFAYLRPTISRQKGHATMRRTSACGKWHVICDVFREDALPSKA